MPSVERINEVLESLLREGTRYRREKIAVLVVYLLIVAVSLLWALTGIELTRELEGRVTVETIADLNRQTFTVRNTGNTDWHDVRVVLNEEYLVELDRLGAGERRRLRPADFRYYYHVPRPWHTETWERIEPAQKPELPYPVGDELDSLTVTSREGPVEVERREEP